MVSAVRRIPRSERREKKAEKPDSGHRLCQLSLSVVNLTVDRSQWRRIVGTGITSWSAVARIERLSLCRFEEDSRPSPSFRDRPFKALLSRSLFLDQGPDCEISLHLF